MFVYPVVRSTGRCVCPMCEDRAAQAEVASLMCAMSPSVYTRFLELLIRPFLASLSEILPSLFPPEWIVCLSPSQRAQPSSLRAAGTACDRLSLQCLFRRMCEHITKEVHPGSPVDVRHLVRDIVSSGESIYARLLTRRRLLWGNGGPTARRRFRVSIVRMLAQIETIRGTDVVLHRLRSQLEDLNSNLAVSYTPLGLCKFACSVGMVERMMQLAIQFGESCYLAKASRSYLDELVRLLKAVLLSEYRIRIAVAMALHHRLGAGSGLGVIGPDLLPMCIPTVICKPIGTWSPLLDGLSTGAAARLHPHSLATHSRLGGGAAP